MNFSFEVKKCVFVECGDPTILYRRGGYYLPAKSVQDFDVQIIDVLSYFFTIYFYLLL